MFTLEESRYCSIRGRYGKTLGEYKTEQEAIVALDEKFHGYSDMCVRDKDGKYITGKNAHLCG